LKLNVELPMAAFLSGGGWSTLTTTLGNTSPEKETKYFVVNDLTSSLYAGNGIATNTGALLTTIVGSYAGGQNQGSYNSFFGAHTGKKNESGFNNTFVGASAGSCNITGNESTYIGASAGMYSRGSKNTFLGYKAGEKNLGQNNIFLGVAAGALDASSTVNNSIVLGNAAYSTGEFDIAIGHNAKTIAQDNGIVLGHNTQTTQPNSTVIGNNIINYGSNVFLVQTSIPYAFSDAQKYINYESDIININDRLIMGTGSNSRFSLNIDNITIGGSNSSLKISPSNIALISPNVSLQGACNISLSNKAGYLAIGPSNVNLQATTYLTIGTGSNTTISLGSNTLIGVASNIYFSNAVGYIAVTSNNSSIFNSRSVSVIAASNDQRVGLVADSSNLEILGWSNSIKFFEDGDMSITSPSNMFLDGGQGVTIVSNDTYIALDTDGVSLSSGSNGVGVYINENKISMTGPTDIASTLMVQGPTDLSNNLSVQGTANFSSNLNVLGVANLSSNLYVLGTANLSNDLSVLGTTNISSNLNVLGVANLSSNLYVLGTANLSNDLSVLGTTNISSNINVHGSANITSNLDVSGVASFSSNLNVLGIANLSNHLNVLGAANITSNLHVLGGTYIQSNLSVNGDTSISSNFVVFGVTAISNDAYIAGSLSLSNNLSITGAATISSNVNVVGDATFSSNINVKTLQVIDAALIGNDLVVNGNSTIQQDLAVLNNTTLEGTLHVVGASILESNLGVLGALDVLGISSFQNDVLVQSNLAIDGGLTVNKDSTFSQDIDIVGSTVIGSNLDVYGDAYFHKGLYVSSNLIISGPVDFQSNVSGVGLSNFFMSMLSNNLPNFSNIFIPDLSNLLSLLSNLSNVPSSGLILYGDGRHDPCSAFFDPDSVVIEHSLIINSNLHVSGETCFEKLRVTSMSVGDGAISGNVTFTSNVGVLGMLSFGFSNNQDTQSNELVTDGWWKQYVEYSSNSVDLIFRSRRGTIITFQDEFYPEVLNFTGKHRCVTDGISKPWNKIGLIVVASGKYENLKGELTIGIDEAIPIIELSRKKKDKRVFGVIGGVEEEGKFRIGNMSFQGSNNPGLRTVVQSTGEGGIWVCNINGALQNGDYITTSIVEGIGMRQDEDYNANFTVAKITCDCSFDTNSSLYECYDFNVNGAALRKAFVGCIYCC